MVGIRRQSKVECEKKAGVYYARMVDTVYQPPAAMSPQRASWQKEMSNAPRRSGKQQKKWRAGMVLELKGG